MGKWFGSVLFAVLLLTVCGFLVACGGGGGGDSDDSGSSGDGSDIGASADDGGFSTRCGIVTDGSNRNPVDSERGEQVQIVSVLDSNAIVVTDGSSQTLVKLQGIGGTAGFTNTAALDLYSHLSTGQLYFFRAGDCSGTVIGGQTGAVGSIVNASGQSFAEELIAAKYAGVIETDDGCGAASLSACFQTVSDTNEHHVYGAPKECDTMPPSVRYRPADTDCGGNASIVVNNEQFGDVFSIQLRYPDGTDRIIDSCETANCTPLKVQDYIRTDSLTVGCFGAPGNSVALSDINHVSIKREADDGEPPRYCIADPRVAVN